MSADGQVEAIYIGPVQSGPLGEVPEVQALAGKGLVGDRNYRENPPPDEEAGRDITLIETEALEALSDEHGIALGPGESRRQVHTSGVRLNPLVGKRFMVGEVECMGIELCEPCNHLQKLTQPGVIRGLVHRGGLRADILSGGTIRRGDPVREVPDRAEAAAT